MTKSDIFGKIAENTGILKVSKVVVEAVLKATGEYIHTELTTTEAGKAKVPYVGTFIQKERKARIGRNPSTGAPVEIAAKKIVAYKSDLSKDL